MNSTRRACSHERSYIDLDHTSCPPPTRALTRSLQYWRHITTGDPIQNRATLKPLPSAPMLGQLRTRSEDLRPRPNCTGSRLLLLTGVRAKHAVRHARLSVLLFLHDLAAATRLDARAGTFSLVAVHAPVEDVVVLISLANEEVAEELAKVGVIGLVVKAEGTGVVEENPKLIREATAEEPSNLATAATHGGNT